MRKKIALLLALVMTMTLLPISVYAASTNTLSNNYSNVPAKTLFYQRGLTGTDVAFGANVSDDVENYRSGMDLSIQLKNNASEDDTFILKLNNAKWFFRNANAPEGDWNSAKPTYDNATDTWSNTSRTYTHTATGINNDDADYTLEVLGSNKSEAVVTITSAGGVDADKYIKIPMVCVTTEEDVEVSVNIISENSPLTDTKHVLASVTSGATKSYVNKLVYGRDEIVIETLAIEELRNGSFKADKDITLSLSSGFEFGLSKTSNLIKATTATSTDKNIYGIERLPGNTLGTQVTAKVTDTDEITITLAPSFTSTTNTNGRIYLKDLVIVPEDDDTAFDKDIVITVKGSSDSGVTTERVVIGQRTDWGFKLTTTTKVPELIAGRFELKTSYPSPSGYPAATAANISPDDENHKTARVKIEETTENSGFFKRQTKIVLPEGVKFIKAEVNDIKELNGIVKNDYVYGFKTKYGSDPKLSIDGNTLTIGSLTVNTGKKATLVLDIWVSIAADYEGDDITLSLEGNSQISGKNDALVIATVQKPVTVTTKVTDVQIGYQAVPVADVTITENVAEALMKNRSINLYMQDVTKSTDIVFTDSYKVEVTDGDLKLTDHYVKGFGEIELVIDKVSTKPATITLSNLQVKINRSVPESNARPYNLAIAGDAIVANGGYDSYARRDKVNMDQFDVDCLEVPFLKVTTSALDITVNKKEVRLVIGQAKYTVAGEEFEMDATPYLSTASNSTMVPLRFVAYALGINQADVQFDDTTKTATIFAPGRVVQFVSNSNKMKVNGAEITMINEAGATVSTEVVGDRMYVPFRQIGNAMGYSVDWDAATQTVFFNKAS